MTTTREQVFDELERMGVVVARCHYYGGHDEGFVDIELFKHSADDLARLGEPDIEMYEGENDLSEALAEPIYDELGSGWYDGTEDQDGHLYWHVSERKVTIDHSYLDWISEPEKEV